jgi:hypothetical protein
VTFAHWPAAPDHPTSAAHHTDGAGPASGQGYSSPHASEQARRYLSRMTPPFRTTLWRVLGIQLVTLVILWLMQTRYAS